MRYSPYAKIIRPTGNPRNNKYFVRNRGAAQRRRAYRQRYVVPRTMGPFAQSESKYFDSFLSADNVFETAGWADHELDPATLNTLFCPVEGSDIDNRIGRKVSVYKISIRAFLSADADVEETAMQESPSVRLILYMDTQTNGTQAQAEEVMEDPGASIGTTFCSFQNKANFGRFRVLKDKTYYMRDLTAMRDGATAATPVTASQSSGTVAFKMTHRFRNPIDIRFNATSGGTIGDIVDNSFHLIGTKNNSDSTSRLTYVCRTYYKDK